MCLEFDPTAFDISVEYQDADRSALFRGMYNMCPPHRGIFESQGEYDRDSVTPFFGIRYTDQLVPARDAVSSVLFGHR